MSVPTSPTRRGARRLVVATALALGLTAAAFASPASAEPTTTTTWPTHTRVSDLFVPSTERTIVLDGQAGSVGKSVFIRWVCGGQVVQEATILLQANAFGAPAGGSVIYPPAFNSGGPGSNCTLIEQWPNSLGQPATPVTRRSALFDLSETRITHP